MSKKVSILEGQKGSKFSGVRYLRTNLSGGGVCEWVPEDGVKLTTKRITKNGEYLARSEKDSQNNPYYAFSQVTVSVNNSTTGTKDPSTGGDGNEYSVSVDDDGMLTEKVLPSKIKIETLPTKLSYLEGETIEMTGSIVKAYKKDGTIWESDGYAEGIIPIEELALDPNIASGGGAGDFGSISGLPLNITSRKQTELGEYVYFSTGKLIDMTGWSEGQSRDVGPVHAEYVRRSMGGYYFFVITYKGYGWDPISLFYQNVAVEIEGEQFIPNGSTTGNITRLTLHEFAADTPTSGNKIDLMNFIDDVTVGSGGGSGEITVTWNRPEDFKALTDTFEIEVTPSN